MTDGRPTLALYLQVETRHGHTQMVAHPATVAPDGSLRTPQWLWGDTPAAEALADFSVHGIIDQSHAHVWGLDHSYEPYRLRLDQAESIVRVLRKLRKGIRRLNEEQGHASDFATYVFRIASLLGIRTYYVRNTDEMHGKTGEMFSRADAGHVQFWISDHEKELCNADPTA